MKYLKIILLMIMICSLLRIFVGEPCYIPSESMESTLHVGDYVWVDKISYGALLPSRFADIPLLNVFTWFDCLRMADEKNHWKTKRLKGRNEPQVRDVVVFRNPQNRNILLVKRVIRKFNYNGISFYYVVGDNNDNSVDSRSFGEIPETAIVGKVNRVLFSTKERCRILKKVN